MALKWSEIESSSDFQNADDIVKDQKRSEFLSKVKPQLSPDAYKIVEDRVMLKEQPSNQYGTAKPEPFPEVPFDINTGIQAQEGVDLFPDIPTIPDPQTTARSAPQVTEKRLVDMKWSDVQQTEGYKLANPKGREELAKSWLRQKEPWLSPEAFAIVRQKVNDSIFTAEQPPAVQEQAAREDPGILKRLLGVTQYAPVDERIRNPYAGEQIQQPMATREEMIAAGFTEPSETEKAIGLTEPKLKTLADIQGLQEPGFVESMLNPAEMAAMGGSGAVIAMRYGKPLVATTLDYALSGAPSVAKGLKGFVKGFVAGAKGIERIAASRNVPTSNTLDIMEAPLLDNWAEMAKTQAFKDGKFVGKTYTEDMAQHVQNTKEAMTKYFKDNGFSPQEIEMILKTGDVPPLNPLYETRLLPGPPAAETGAAPVQGELFNIAKQGKKTVITPKEFPAKQMELPLQGAPAAGQEPITIPGRRIQLPEPTMRSGVTPDDLDHPYLGNINARVRRSGSWIKDPFREAAVYIENPIRMFQKAGGNLKREVYDKIEDADMASLREFHDRFLPVINEWKKKANPKRLAVYMINRQDEGHSILKNMGVNVEKELSKLTPDEMAIANHMDDFYREFYHRINVARMKAGLPEMGFRKDYFTFYRQMDWLEKNMGHNPLELQNIDEILKSKFIHPNSTFFGEALSRANNDFIPVELDAFQSFGRYAQNSLNHINLSPEIARGRKVIQQISKSHPELYGDITNWLDFVSGKQHTILPPAARRFLLATNKRLALSVLSWNFRTMLVQPTALRNTYAKAGLVDTLGGIYDVLMSSKPLKWASKAGQDKADLVRKNSNLLGRKFDVAVDDILKLAKGPIQKIGKAGMRPMQEIDMLTAEASWHAFHRQGKKLGLKGKDLIRYANDNVVLTQASGRRQHLARVQRNDIGRLISTLQTFVINDWGFLTQDVLGMGKNVPMNKANVGRAYRWLAGTILVNTFFEDVLNIYSPYPSPIRRTMEEINKKDADFWTVAEGLGKELLDVAPLIGSAVRYRTGLWGPTFEAGRRFLEGEQRLEQAAKLTGIPMSFLKIPKRISEGKGPVATAVGEKPKEKKKKGKTMKKMTGGGKIGSSPRSNKKKFRVMTPLS